VPAISVTTAQTVPAPDQEEHNYVYNSLWFRYTGSVYSRWSWSKGTNKCVCIKCRPNL